MVHDLNLHINGLFFLQNLKKPFSGYFWALSPKLDFFPKNLAESVFYFQGTLRACLHETQSEPNRFEISLWGKISLQFEVTSLSAFT